MKASRRRGKGRNIKGKKGGGRRGRHKLGAGKKNRRRTKEPGKNLALGLWGEGSSGAVVGEGPSGSPIQRDRGQRNRITLRVQSIFAGENTKKKGGIIRLEVQGPPSGENESTLYQGRKIWRKGEDQI